MGKLLHCKIVRRIWDNTCYISSGCYNKILTEWFNQHLFLTSLESGNSKIKVLADSILFFFLQTYFAALDLSCGTRNIHCAMLASAVAACSLSLIVAHGLQSMRASVVGVHRLRCSEACEILVPWPGIKPSSPALQAGLLTSGPSGKSLADSAQVPFLGLWEATFLLCHHMAKRESGSQISAVSSYKVAAAAAAKSLQSC